jgi:signal transduction histidine kinase
VEAGERGLRPEPFNLGELCRDLIEGLQQGPGGERLRLRTDSPAVPVFADPTAVGQIVSNLVDNALKYAPGADPIDVTIRGGSVDAIVEVADTGPGIPAHELPYIFDRFRQVDGSATRRASGVGLGLYIVRNLVEGMSGRIWCESTPGEGTRFSFTLPAHALEEVMS